MQHRARKRFGQNFLTDRRVIERIVNTIRPAKGELVLEIGPGQAALSEPLSESGAELHLLEIDRDLAVRLQSRFASGAGAQIHTADALKVNFSELLGYRRRCCFTCFNGRN
jgi:16S rRNA (adenine1518-N6/adenine1519-N6)-dimethyltransferase